MMMSNLIHVLHVRRRTPSQTWTRCLLVKMWLLDKMYHGEETDSQLLSFLMDRRTRESGWSTSSMATAR